jgi:hypothetical protein
VDSRVVRGNYDELWVRALQLMQEHELLAHSRRVLVDHATSEPRLFGGPVDAFFGPRGVPDDQKSLSVW